MNFYEHIIQSTENERLYLTSASIFSDCFAGNIQVEDYVAFLSQAYQHVKHTTPLLMAVGSRLPEEKEWLRNAVAEYIEEELGHQEWVLNDIAACGFDAERARHAAPNMETELMVSYAYDTVQRKNPLGFFGMVHVLEGTSIASADSVAEAVQKNLGLPNSAFSYLRSHGALDIEHIEFFKTLMNRIESSDDQRCIIHCAKMFYILYGNMLRGLSPHQAIALAA